MCVHVSFDFQNIAITTGQILLKLAESILSEPKNDDNRATTILEMLS